MVSHHISQLEAHLGVALIYRSTRKLSLTPEGERLLVATRNMLAAVEDEFVDISGSAKHPSGELRVTLPSVLSHSVLSDAIAKFAINYPRINLILDFSDAAKDLIDDGFDVAFRMWLKPTESSTSKVLCSVRRRLVASSSYLEGRPKVDDLRSLEEWDWIVLSTVSSHRGIVFKSPDKVSVKAKPKVRIYSNDSRSIFSLVLAGAGIGIMPGFLAESEVAAGRLKYLLPDWELEAVKVFAEWPANAPKDGLVHLLVSELSDYISVINPD